MFGARGEALSRFLSKGTQIAVEGKLRWHEWESAAGEKRSGIEVVADDIELLGGRGEGGGASAPRAVASAAPEPADEFDGEDIPF
jgi:single-strand DNA-binding protein